MGKVRKMLNLRDSPVIVFVGAIRPVKSVHLLVRAFNPVKKKIPEAKLVIIIEKPTLEYYWKQIRREAERDVIFIDSIPNEELPSYYAACNLYTTCSLWETFNRPLAEAQACGRPVVAFNIGSHPEVINDNAALVEKGDIGKFAPSCIEKLEQVRGIS